MDMEEKEGVFQDRRQQYIQTTQNMYLGGVPQDYTVMTKDFDSVILNSLKGGCIRHLTFDDKYVYFIVFKILSVQIDLNCCKPQLELSVTD